MTGGTGVTGGLTVLPVDGIGEVGKGDDLAALLAEALAGEGVGPAGLTDGDIVVLTSKVVSKAEGRTATADRAAVLPDETDRVVARRGPTTVVRTRHGLVLAGGGIDASNVESGTSLLLPLDPDASARGVRERLHELTALNVGVVVSDTAGRAWRMGQTDLAIGAAGIEVLQDYSGQVDPYGNDLVVTAPALADEIAAAGDLVKGKLGRRPAAVVRGLDHLVLPAGEHGTGAVALVRPEEQDMFGLGAREAVLAALGQDHAALRGFGAAVPAVEAADLLAAATGSVVEVDGGTLVVRLAGATDRARGAQEARVTMAAFALGWLAGEAGSGTAGLRLRPATP